MCKEVGGEILWSHYQVVECGFDPFSTAEAQLLDEEKEEQRVQSNREFKTIGVLAAIAFILLLALVLNDDENNDG